MEQAGWPSSDEPQALTRDYTPLLAKVAVSRSFAFRLVANPTQARRTHDPTGGSTRTQPERPATRSARLGHRTAAYQLRWLSERIPQWGFDIPAAQLPTHTSGADDGILDVRITGRTRRSFSRRRGEPPIVIQMVTYEGRLIVTDPDALRARLLGGVGAAKAYGCGLLTLAPLTATDGQP